jgi:high-affinity Fe2+/Pb2+ permease
MSLIKAGITSVCIVFALIAAYQAYLNPSAALQAGILVIVLLIIPALLFFGSKDLLKRGEMAALWLLIFVFAGYGVLKAGGML